MINNQQEIRNYFIQNFEKLFTISNPNIPTDLEGLMVSIILENDNIKLIETLVQVEINNILFKMLDLKAHVPDGMPTLFFKSNWKIVGKLFIEAIDNFLLCETY